MAANPERAKTVASVIVGAGVGVYNLYRNVYGDTQGFTNPPISELLQNGKLNNLAGPEFGWALVTFVTTAIVLRAGLAILSPKRR